MPALLLSPNKWREHPDLGSVLPGVPFVRSDWAWCDAKFSLGKADAAAHHDELAAFFGEATAAVPEGSSKDQHDSWA